MDPTKIGSIIRTLRLEAGQTQKQLAEALAVTDKAVSKWEADNGCPDISILTELASLFGVELRSLLSGKIEKKESEIGNMKKIKFYVCKSCGNVITSTSGANIACCGKTIEPLVPRKAADNERLALEEIAGEWFITTDHSMTKDHYISFVAYTNDSTAMLFKQYPEWNLQVHLPLVRSGRLT